MGRSATWISRPGRLGAVWSRHILPEVAPARLVALYGEAFQGLLILLAGITAITALIVFLFLGSEDAHLPAQAGDDAPASPKIGDAAAEADAPQGRKNLAGTRPEFS